MTASKATATSCKVLTLCALAVVTASCDIQGKSINNDVLRLHSATQELFKNDIENRQGAPKEGQDFANSVAQRYIEFSRVVAPDVIEPYIHSGQTRYSIIAKGKSFFIELKDVPPSVCESIKLATDDVEIYRPDTVVPQRDKKSDSQPVLLLRKTDCSSSQPIRYEMSH